MEATMSESFPFQLQDIKSWIIRKKDGSIIRYNFITQDDLNKTNERINKHTVHHGPTAWNGFAGGRGGTYKGTSSYSAWCEHKPTAGVMPIFQKDGISLYIASASGARAVYNQFDVAIDGGNALTVPGEHDLPILYGAPELSTRLAKHIVSVKSTSQYTEPCKILKIRWNDRCAPPLQPSFWPALLEQLKALQAKKEKAIESSGSDDPTDLRVLTICQGGHGRSGSALAALIMCLTDYTPLDALTHVRALHCARAIESKEQHSYLNLLGTYLKREADAMDAEEVKSFKDRFLTLDNIYAEPYKERVRGGKGAVVADREAGFL
jgi:hypothetical protein